MSYLSLFELKTTTRPTRKEPYTGFVFTQRPRWPHSRSHPRFDSHPVLPPHLLHSTSPPSPHLQAPPTHPTPPHLQAPPTHPPPPHESTTQWWPPGVSLGSRPPVSRIPIPVIYPEIAKLEFDWRKVFVRTSGTRFTYAPEVENYPVTFDWNVPRHLRQDKWTQRPDWPLESPLFSSEAYDYLEERTLPRILESGETEYPPTTQAPWWTYPPWWLEKKALETVNGTTPRPYTRKTSPASAKTATTFGTTEPTFTVRMGDRGIVGGDHEVSEKVQTTTTGSTTTDLADIKMTTNEIEAITKNPQGIKTVVHDVSTHVPRSTTEQVHQKELRKKTHHKGPWWHLTIVEHLSTKPPGDQGNKRVKRSPKLVRQNAIRRKWRKMRAEKNLSHTLNLTGIKPVTFTDGNKSPSIERVLSNFTFTWPNISQTTLSKIYIENVLSEALDELRQHLNQEKEIRGKIDLRIKSEVHAQNPSHVDVEKHLDHLTNLFLTALNNFTHKQRKRIRLHIITNEISKGIVKQLLSSKNLFGQQLIKFFLPEISQNQTGQKDIHRNHFFKSRIFSLFKLFYTHDVIHYDISKQIIDIFQSIFQTNITNHLNSNYTHSNYDKIVKEQHNFYRKIISEEHMFRRKKREDITDITECPFNMSEQSVERVVNEVVDEIVEEMPIGKINEDLTSQELADMHENQLKRLGKTNINKGVLREMARLETIDEAKFRNKTEASVRKVIMKMVNEVINTLRQSQWKDSIIKLFEEGYSVDSVLESISNQISIEELMESMAKDGINITRYQKKLVLEEFKDYKSLLRKMLSQEVQLWEYQLSKNESLIRHKRSVSNPNHVYGLEKESIIMGPRKTVFLKKDVTNNLSDAGGKHKHGTMANGQELLRTKRDVNDNEISKSINNDKDEYDENDDEFDRELAELKKSSMPKREKIKVLKKRLKGLLSQTENPDDIVFPDNFEEELMRTENFFDEITQSPQRFKQRIRWNVRTKKPTTKVITYPMKIRLNRGRPFVPLTTTEEQTLIMMVTQAPVRKYRTKKPATTKMVLTPTEKTTLAASKRPKVDLERKFWLDFTTFPADYGGYKSVSKASRTTLKPLKTFATLRTFKTMKFVQKTQQPVISLQEFLKRRNEFRREKQGGLFNRPSSEEETKQKSDKKNLSDLSEEEEVFSFETKLSAEVNPSMFTFPPRSPTTSESPNTVAKPPLESILVSTKPTATSQKVTKKKVQRKRPAVRSNRTRTQRTSTISVKNPEVTNWTSQVFGNIINETTNEKLIRRKRDLSSLETITDPNKARGDLNDITIPPLVISDEKLRGLKKNVSRHSLEGRIHLHNWAYGVRQPKGGVATVENLTDSFETYQQEHKKWFGVKKRGVPVNNYDIDWDQMQRKMEIHQLSAWQRQKPSFKPTVSGKQMKKSERIATPLTQATTPLFLDSSEKPSNVLDSLYKSTLKKTVTKSFAKYYISDESVDSKIKNFSYPPFGKMEKDGHTAFGRLFQGKKHYTLEDSREKHFNDEDLKKLINKTYDPAFRISTHRKSNWNNRTFDPNYVFTQFVPLPGKTRTKVKFTWREAIGLFENENSTCTQSSTILTNTPPTPPGVEDIKYMHSTNKPKYKQFEDEGNITEVITQGNESYVKTRSKRVPWDNTTDIETYKTYIRSRKRFYNKTIDIAFSYYIFHKFRCGNKTRDLGYGRMSNVVNRWYNKTFVPKYRPDMFYVRNRYKRGKEFNYFKDEMNEIHTIISYGEFNPSKWMQVATETNLEEASRTNIPPDEKKEVNQKKRIIDIFSSALSRPTQVPVTNLKPSTTSQRPSKVPTTKASFFQAVKEKGFGFFRSLFGKQESNENKGNKD